MELSDILLKKYGSTLLAFTRWDNSGVSKCTIDLSQVVGPTQARWLRELGLGRPFAVLTAWNPDGVLTSEDANDVAHEALKGALKLAGMDTSVSCIGCSPDMMHMEPGLAVMMDKEEAMAVGRTFGQLAMFWYESERFWIVPLRGAGQAVVLPLV